MKQKLESYHAIDAEENPAGGRTTGTGIVIDWQNGPLGTGENRKEPNGAFVEGVIEAALDRLLFYQTTKFSCIENSIAIANLRCSLAALDVRTKNREACGVEGTHSL